MLIHRAHRIFSLPLEGHQQISHWLGSPLHDRSLHLKAIRRACVLSAAHSSDQVESIQIEVSIL
jgi:hypothetical protein